MKTQAVLLALILFMTSCRESGEPSIPKDGSGGTAEQPPSSPASIPPAPPVVSSPSPAPASSPSPSPITNLAPTIIRVSPAAEIVNANERAEDGFDFMGLASDPENGRLSYEWTLESATRKITVNNGMSRLSLQNTLEMLEPQDQEITIHLKAIDPLGLSVALQWKVNVTHRSIYASQTTGNDSTGTGTPWKPLMTIQKAVERAIQTGKSQVRVSEGSYLYPLHNAAISLEGGYDSLTWTLSPNSVSTLWGGMLPVRVDGIRAPVSISHFSILGGDTDPERRTGVGLLVSDCTALTLESNEISAPDGRSAVELTAGASGFDGFSGAVGGNASRSEAGLGGAAISSFCRNQNTSGGRGGRGNVTFDISAQRGQNAASGSGAFGLGGNINQRGADGVSGIAGAFGSSPLGIGKFSNGTFVESKATDGKSGLAGGGGGGGGGAEAIDIEFFVVEAGGGGGSGGTGGCMGDGGMGGATGGSSFGLVILDSTVTLQRNLIVAGRGAGGSAGGIGGIGGFGGTGGVGGASHIGLDQPPGGSGGYGGRGGNGGNGGSGNGGWSVGLYTDKKAVVNDLNSNVFAPKDGGFEGVNGTSRGQPGQSLTTYREIE